MLINRKLKHFSQAKGIFVIVDHQGEQRKPLLYDCTVL